MIGQNVVVERKNSDNNDCSNGSWDEERILTLKGGSEGGGDDDDGKSYASSTDGGSTPSNGIDGTNKQPKKNGNGNGDDNAILSQKENRSVLCVRLAVLFVLLASTIAVAAIVYKYITNSELVEFETQFDADATKILTSLGAKFDLTLGAIDAFVVSIVSYAADTNSTFPFVTLPHFAVRAKKIQSLSDAVYLNVYMVVDNTIKEDGKNQRDAWEEYTAKHNYWVNESIQIQAEDETFHGRLNHTFTTLDVVHDDFLTPLPYPGDANYTEARSTLMPIWQAYPVVPSVWGYPVYNWDSKLL